MQNVHGKGSFYHGNHLENGRRRCYSFSCVCHVFFFILKIFFKLIFCVWLLPAAPTPLFLLKISKKTEANMEKKCQYAGG